MNTALQDIQFAIRLLRKNAGFTVVVIITLALGIGANAVIFSVVNAVMLRPLPVSEPDRLLMVFHSYPKLNLPRAAVMPFALGYYREHLKSFSSIAAATMWRGPQNLSANGEAQRVKTALVSADFFPTLGVEPALGRRFVPEEDAPGKNREVMLSDGLWKQQFGSDHQIVGKSVALDNVNYTIIGVMPQGFQMPSGAELWTPIAFSPEEARSTVEYLDVIGRLKPGVTPQQADAELAQTSAELLRQFPELEASGFRVIEVKLSETVQENLRPALLVLLAAVGCVLLIACVNVANLLLARAAARQKEIAVRTALGATRSRLVRQVLTESAVLSISSGLLGLLLAYRGTDVLLALVPVEMPSFVHITVDAHVVLFTFAVAVLTGILFGIFPALHVSGRPSVQSLNSVGRNSSIAGGDKTRNALVVIEIGFALVLLVCSGLLIRTFVRIRQSDPGFRPAHTLTGWVALRPQVYRSDPQIVTFYQQLLDRVATLPQVNKVAVGSTLPLITDWTQTFALEGQKRSPDPHAFFATVSSQYFSALGIPLLQGRTFSESDRLEGAPVVMVDERAAHAYWPGENPIGNRINFDGEKKPVWREVVGIVGSVKRVSALADESKGAVYLPFSQVPMRAMSIVIRSNGNPADLGVALRRSVAQLDPAQAVYDVLTMDYMLSRFVAEPRFNMVLLALFGILALLLSSVGIYGVISYWVSQRTREMGIRIALGASRGEVMRLVLVQTLRLVGIGLIVGVLAAMIATRALSSLLFHVNSYDPLTFAATIAVLSTVALVAGYIPARRATKVDPMIALRYE